MSAISSESGHWYKKTGEPFYEIESKSKPGTMRPVTLRDAKKLDLVPSVTTITRIVSSPGLDQWKQRQVLMAALTLPKIDGESDNDYISRILADAQEQARKAAEKGTSIHGAIEKFLRKEFVDPEYKPYIMPVLDEMERRGWLVGVQVEHSFAHPLGFGGKTDFRNNIVLSDFKTKEFTDTSKQLAWPEHCWQLSAYRFGLQAQHLECYNVFISTNKPGLFHFHKWPEEEIEKGLQVFLSMLDLWKKIKL